MTSETEARCTCAHPPVPFIRIRGAHSSSCEWAVEDRARLTACEHCTGTWSRHEPECGLGLFHTSIRRDAVGACVAALMGKAREAEDWGAVHWSPANDARATTWCAAVALLETLNGGADG